MLGAWLSSAAILSLSVGVILISSRHEDESLVLAQYKAAENKVPKLQYPKKDLRGREIPDFDSLIVMPDCKSCSNFRKNSQEYMAKRADQKFLILTPDLMGLDDLLQHGNYYVSIVKSGSKLADIAPGTYFK